MTGFALAVDHLGPSRSAVAATNAAATEVALMRQKVELLRDVLISLSMQLVFRATFLLRHFA